MPKRKSIRILRVGNTKILTHGERHIRLSDPYHLVLALTWPGFFLALVIAFFLLNLLFAMTWTLIHIIDEKSPFFGQSASEIVANHPRITVSVSGHDETMAATVYASHNYEARDIVFDAHFVDIISETPEGDRIVNMTRFHGIKPAATHTEPQHDL
ncbi:MAG: hypothetical protein G3I10_10130 [Ferrovum sp.]|nr:hypothetical protein [Ferrovum sp.]